MIDMEITEKRGNFVADDQIWKDHVVSEHKAAKRWPQHWGFMTRMNRELAGIAPDADNADASVNVKNRQEALKLPPIDNKVLNELGIGKPIKPFPKTSSQFVGWRSTEIQCRLEKYGRYTKESTTFLNDLKWPAESMY